MSDALKKSIVDAIEEGQLKLGYREETIRLYYPLSSLCTLMHQSMDAAQMTRALTAFSEQVKGELGEIEYENFNAAAATVKVRGLNIHPGSAKNKMKNAALLLAEFIGLLPAAETPAHTEGYEGFFHLCEMSGDESSAEAAYIIRDHNREKFETRKVLMQQTADFMNQKYGAGTFTLHMTDSYYNMKEKLTDHMYLIHNAEAAMQKAGVTPKIVAIRGGTDGARLSYEGLPCPNLSTGGLNFHSIHEFIPVRSLEKMVEVLRNLVTL